MQSIDELQRLGLSRAQARAPALLIPIYDVSGDLAFNQIRPDTPRKNDKFNRSQSAGQVDKFSFERAEAPFSFVCNIHTWMSAWAFVLSHPFSAVTDNKGHFEIKGLPAGEYTFTAWHENFGDGTFTVTVEDGKAATADFELGK